MIVHVQDTYTCMYAEYGSHEQMCFIALGYDKVTIMSQIYGQPF